MKDLKSPLEEQSLFETWIITSHLSNMAYDLLLGKRYKKIINNDSLEATRINTLNRYRQITGSELSQETREKFDDFLHRLEMHTSFLESLRDIKLYPSKDLPLWNKHIEIYNELEKNNFCKSSATEMHNFLFKNFLIPEYKFIEIEKLMQRDFNIFLILFHLDASIFQATSPKVSLYKYLLIGKIQNTRKSPHHLFWNIVKILACIESNKQIGTFFDTSKKIPKDEDCFSLVNEDQAERIKYAVRKLKEGKSFFFYLNDFYQLLGTKTRFKDTKCFTSFSITGIWLIYIYSTILIKPNSILCNLTSKDLDALYLMFKTQYRSKGTYQWPSDLTK